MTRQLTTKRLASLALALAATLAISAGSSTTVRAQQAYGVDASMRLFRFDVATPGTATTVGFLNFLPEGIDFRPSTSELFAIDVGPNTTQLYQVNISTAAATPIGAGFTSAGTVGTTPYDLTTARSFGFDFNPKTVQPDGSIRIRLTGDNGANLRLHSATGGIAAVDGSLAYAAGDPNFGTAAQVSGSAYTNNFAQLATGAGPTTLYDIDHNLNLVATQVPPNNGTLNTVGALGANANSLLGFDIYTNPMTSVNTAYAAVDVGGVYRLHTINLATGAASVGLPTAFGFEGGLAVIPEPGTGTLALLAIAGTALVRRRYRRRLVTS